MGDADGQIVGDHAGRSNGVGRVLRAQGPSRLRPGPGRARAIGVQSSHIQQRASGLGAARQPPALDAIQRRGRLAELPLRFEAGRSLLGQSVPGNRRDELSKQGVPDVSFGGYPTPIHACVVDLASQPLLLVAGIRAVSAGAALLNPSVAKGLVLVDRGCRPRHTTSRASAGGAPPRRLRRSPRHPNRNRDRCPRGSSPSRAVRRSWAASAVGGQVVDAQPGRTAASAATVT